MTRSNEIGANSYLADFGDDGCVILDAGMHPRLDGNRGTPNFAPSRGKNIKGIFLTHSHHDHVGALPLAMREHSDVPVFMSEGSYFLADPLLHNSVEVMIKQRDEYNIPEYPLFTHGELAQLVQRWRSCGLEKPYSFHGQAKPKNDPLTFAFYDAGHILGSVGVLLNHRGRRIFYTGDINFTDQTLMKAASFPTEKIDVLITETTKGASPKKEDRSVVIEKLVKEIEETFENGGSVLIPIFAMGKTQEFLAEVYLQLQKGRIGKRPIFIGGLGKNFSAIYDKLAKRSTRFHPDLKLLNHGMPEVMDGKRVRNFKPRKGDLYLISSGMMTEKTLSNTLGQKFLENEKNSIFFVGYCDTESPAGRLLATPKGDYVVLESLAGEQQVNCKVKHFDLTSHALREDILDYILRVNPRVCMLVHGDPEALAWFKGQINTLRPEIQVVIPPAGETIEV
ncbi:RNA processing exonuclease, beta-lactamase fold, Cft2 family [Verrucomicrobium sp. GAS474]|uniref:MBL fold metallo-hydrolase n=1 Tax=Verrucomicrobium sp. GAS474 TaxID=1882831 RepID=UPI00087D0604|nr:MBL fold metallo-hydrolase [Verrucomicrobium sp. GAS474]SDT86064.1 RNA processing exonuclease, beta-lactamase fold, Cft2 family [Verrucomicrobium sp. GAS474]